nr:hypothetical protein Iba_chr01aCG17140 [Ipomoea batatas]
MKVIDGRATTTAFVARQRQYSPVIGVCAELPASSPSPATEATARLGAAAAAVDNDGPPIPVASSRSAEVSSGGLRFRLQQRPSFLVDAEDGGNNDLAGQSYNAPDGIIRKFQMGRPSVDQQQKTPFPNLALSFFFPSRLLYLRSVPSSPTATIMMEFGDGARQRRSREEVVSHHPAASVNFGVPVAVSRR